ncbi:tail fiber domain-containing protein [Ferruginibacter sp.]
MKKLFPLVFLIIFANNIIAQNVGIGTSTPTDKFSIVNALPGYGITHTYGPVTMGTYISNLYGQFGTKTNHPLQFFTNNGSAQITLLQNGNTGIGIATPTAKLHVAGNVFSEGSAAGFTFNDRSDNTKGYQWYSIGGNAYLSRQAAITSDVLSILGNGNIGFNTSAPQTDLHVNPNGAGSILVGTNRNAGGYTNLEMGISTQSGGYSYIQSTKASGSSYGTLQLNPSGGFVTTGGYVGIRTNTPFFPLDIDQPNNLSQAIRILTTGSIWGIGNWNENLFITHNNDDNKASVISSIDGSFNSWSDRRMKKNIEDLSPVLDKVLLLKAKKYQFINTNETTRKSTGFISQEVLDLFPELVISTTRSAEDSTIYHGINYAGFSVIAIKAIQEQQQQIQTQQQIIDAQNKKLEDFEKRLEALEGKK